MFVCSPRGWQIGLSMSIWHGRFPYASSACLSPDPGHLNHRSRSWRLRSSRSASSHCWQWSRALRAAAQQMLSCSQPCGNSPRPKTDISASPLIPPLNTLQDGNPQKETVAHLCGTLCSDWTKMVAGWLSYEGRGLSSGGPAASRAPPARARATPSASRMLRPQRRWLL